MGERRRSVGGLAHSKHTSPVSFCRHHAGTRGCVVRKQCRHCQPTLVSVVCIMGRRKSKRKPPPKKKMTGDLDSQFTCPFCNHEKSCDVKM
ncbi:putative transcription elongation factor 1 -like [Scophthalmus maximus]|uniref:Transcription elongation factor 1 homolog n=1 Tax=Scophthalmus maximus TaxID=52904 RepID=A0A2U9BQ91_SCOMX|nr:putative transcription elongation factor 1 -like [Scophthalmus maximus]KAF0037531.1 hypothetical protein F2P81_010405 [Scophthalmus maximus]